jgi:centromeric protein E
MSMSPRSVSFEVSCSSNNDENFHVIDSSKCHIRLGINHNVGCPNGASSKN